MLRLVLSADPVAIVKNEGYEPKDGKYVFPATSEFNLRTKSGRIVPHFPSKSSNDEPAWNWRTLRFEPTNGLGVRIGMSKREVERIAGRPAQRLYSKRFGCDELVYFRTTWKRDALGRIELLDGLRVGTKLSNYYLFQNGRLFYIEAAQNLLPG